MRTPGGAAPSRAHGCPRLQEGASSCSPRMRGVQSREWKSANTVMASPCGKAWREAARRQAFTRPGNYTRSLCPPRRRTSQTKDPPTVRACTSRQQQLPCSCCPPASLLELIGGADFVRLGMLAALHARLLAASQDPGNIATRPKSPGRYYKSRDVPERARQVEICAQRTSWVCCWVL